jgi:hypothetical protein
MTPDTTPHDFRPLDNNHPRTAFSCGDTALDIYFRTLAGQSGRRRMSVVHVMSNTVTHDVIGYYTLTNASIDAGLLPDTLVKKNRYRPHDTLGVTLLGRFAIDLRYSRGKGWGVHMYMDASYNALLASRIVASSGILLDTETGNARAREFWVGREFVSLGIRDDGKERFFISMDYIQKLHGNA